MAIIFTIIDSFALYISIRNPSMHVYINEYINIWFINHQKKFFKFDNIFDKIYILFDMVYDVIWYDTIECNMHMCVYTKWRLAVGKL